MSRLIENKLARSAKPSAMAGGGPPLTPPSSGSPPRPPPSGSSSPGSPQLDDYLERVTKYVPVEIIAAYLTIRGIVPAHGSANALPVAVELAIYAALVALTPLYLLRVTGEVPGKLAQIAISTGSFLVWSYAIGGPFFWSAVSAAAHTDVVLPALAGPLAILWTLAVGRFDPAGSGTRG